MKNLLKDIKAIDDIYYIEPKSTVNAVRLNFANIVNTSHLNDKIAIDVEDNQVFMTNLETNDVVELNLDIRKSYNCFHFIDVTIFS